MIIVQATTLFGVRKLRLPLFLLLLIAGLTPAAARAQTTPVANPTTVTFTPSPDHDVRLSDGRAKVASYRFDVYSVGASQPFQSTSLGKPAIGSDGLISYNFSSAIASWPLPGGNYEARVAAVGPTGSGVSACSNPFTFGSCVYVLSGTSASLPAAGGGTQVSVATTSGCAWTAASNVAWIALSTTRGTGNGTVVATVAANTATSTRTGVIAISGRTFTITQAAATVTTPTTPTTPPPTTTPTGLPAPWASQDIGSVGLTGSTSYASGRFTVTGSGADIWGSADSFQFVSQPLSGDGQIVARMTGQQNTDPHAKAGVMMRAGLSSGAAHILLNMKPGTGVEFLKRSASGSTTAYLGGATQAPPSWLRLVRAGSTVTASVSADGSTWRTVGTTTATLGTSIQIGLAVTSHNTGLRNTATFDNVTVSSATGPVVAGLPAPWKNQDIGSVALAGSTSYASGRFTVIGSGADIWGGADAFQFVSQPLSGDGQIVARMTGQQNTDPHAKAGVMMRAGLTAGAAHVLLNMKPGTGVEFLKRSATGGTSTYLAGATQAPPSWLRLVRVGSTVTASVSADGTTWRTVGTTTVTMGTSMYVGLAVTSHNTGLRNTATFDNVTVR